MRSAADRESQACLELRRAGLLDRRAFDDVEHGRHGAVRVHVDGPHPAAADRDLPARLGRGVPHPAGDADHAGRRRSEKAPTIVSIARSARFVVNGWRSAQPPSRCRP